MACRCQAHAHTCLYEPLYNAPDVHLPAANMKGMMITGSGDGCVRCADAHLPAAG